MKNCLALAILVAALSSSALAEVRDSSAAGFTVKTTLALQATPQEVYRRLIRIGEWWGSDHTYSRDAHNLTIEEKAGGCWCEKLPDGGSIQHLQVVFVSPGKILRMVGGLGPLQGMAVTGSMTVQLTPANGGTKLDMTYAVAGYSPAGLNAIAAGVDSVLTDQFARLKNLIERGDPASDQKSSMAK